MSQTQRQDTGLIYPVTGDLCRQMPMLTSLGILGHSAKVIVCFVLVFFLNVDFESALLMFQRISRSLHTTLCIQLNLWEKVRKKIFSFNMPWISYQCLSACRLYMKEKLQSALQIKNTSYGILDRLCIQSWTKDKLKKKKKTTVPDKEENPNSNYPALPLMWKEIRMHKDFYEN